MFAMTAASGNAPAVDSLWLGRLSPDALPFHDPILIATLIMVMPGARIFTMVTNKLMPDNSVPTPAICSPQM